MAKQIGTVVFVKGAVEVRTVEGIIKAVNPGDKLHEGDVLHTGANSEVRIEFFNGQNLVVGENTEFLLDETVFARLEPYADDRAEQLAQLQQALLEGDDLEAPAAGQSRGAANNLHDASDYERIGDEGRVDTQLTPFDVGGGVDAFEPTDDGTAVPLVAPQTPFQPVASIFIDPVTGDGVLNGQEVAADDVPVSGGVGGDAGPGDTVTVRIGDETYSGTVDDNGRFAITVPGSVLAAAGVVTAVVTVGGSDATASAEATVAVDDQIDARISVDPVTGDGLLNAAEAAGDVTITGGTGGDVAPGDTVTVRIGGEEYNGTVGPDGRFAISVPGSVLAASPTVEASVTATDEAGNRMTAQASVPVTVDTATSATISVDPITDDDTINAAEAAGTIPVTGQVAGEAAPGDTVTAIINGTTYSTTVAPDLTYTLSVAGSDLAADTEFVVTVSGVDSAGNPFAASVISTHTVNQPPQAMDDAVSTDEDTPLNAIPVLANDSDPEGGPLTVVSASADHGTVTVNPDGTLNYVPDANYNGPDRISYVIEDDQGEQSSATVQITVNPVNDPATVTADSGSVTEDSAATLIVNGQVTVSDVDTGEAQVQPQNAVAGSYGSFSIDASGNWSYSADNSQAAIQSLAAGETLTESFTVTSADGSASDTVTVTITGTNDAPVLSVSDLSAVEDGPAVTGQAGFSDIDASDSHVYSVSGLPAGQGSVSIDPTTGVYTYTVGNDFQQLAAGETAQVSFDVTVTDDNGASDTRTVTVTVTGTNDAPVISGLDTGTVTEDSVLAASGQLSVSDPDHGESAFQPGNPSGSYGSLVIDPSGNWSYSLDNANPAVQALGTGDSLTDTVTVTTVDGTTHDIVITIHGTNDAPVAVADSFATDEGSSLAINAANGLLANDTDAENDALQVLQVAADASGAGAVSADGTTAISTALGGTVIVHADGSFTYTAPASLDHSANDTLLDSFAYLASDGTDNSNWTTVNIAVGDTVPVAHDDSDSVGYGGTVYGNVITGAGGAGMQADDAGADGPLQLQSVTYNGVTYSGFDANGNLTINAAHGDLLINRDGSYSYSSNDLSGQPLTDDVFSYSVVDGDGDVASATLSLVHDTISTAIADSATVDEAGLPAGTAHDSDSEFARGNLLDNDTGIGSTTQISDLSFNGVSAAPDASGVISISGDFGSLTVWTQDDGSHRAGDYEYRLTSASSGDSVVEQFVYTLSDGAHSSSNTLDIAITDDAPGGDPIVQNLQQDADPAVYNLSIILDVSGSMNTDAGNGLSRLEVARQSLQALINEVDDLGNVNVQIIPFASGTQTSGWFIDDVQGAIDYIDALQANGGTWYDAALNAQINSAAPPPADQNLIYFLSDGEPNAGHGVDDSIQYTDANGNALTGQAAWEAYVEEHADIAFGIGIGTGVSLANLEPVAHPEVNGAEDYAIAVDDPTDLTATLLDTVSNTLIEGSLNVLGAHGNAGFVIGADGGYISEIVVDGVSYTYAPNSGDPSTMTVTTALGGLLEIDFANGDYRYTLDVDQSLLGQHELFPVTVIDNDGDVFSSTIRFNIDYQPALDANRDLVLTNIIDGTPISIGESALLHNDRGDSLSISSTGNALGGVLAANGIAFTPNAGLSVLSEDDFTTDAPAITIDDRNEGGNRNDSMATATDLTDRSLFSSDDANLNGVNVNGYSLAYEGRFDSNSDQDWLSVSLARGENLWLDVDNGGGVNAQASIYDANGNFVTSIDNNAGGPWGGFTAPEDGQYYVVLESANGSTGNYDLFLTINTGSADYSDGSFSYDLTNGAGVSDSTTVDIQGVSGNRITGGDADEILVSGDLGDTLVGNAGDDALLGHGGDDSLDGGAGNDLLVGGAGNDSLIGGDGIDIFALESGDEGSAGSPAVDTIADFTAGQGGDVLDLSDLLQGETDATLDQYLSFSYDSASGNTTVNIDVQGSGSGVSQMIVLEGVDLTAGGTLSDQQILDNLLDDGNLIVDH